MLIGLGTAFVCLFIALSLFWRKRWVLASCLLALASTTVVGLTLRGDLQIALADRLDSANTSVTVPQNTLSQEVEMVSLDEKVRLDVPIIGQYPELPRGCEVTALAMFLQAEGVSVDKMTLAEEVKKDLTQKQVRNGKILFGNPNEGFVGDMYDKSNPGYGVYHGPIFELASRYLPGQIIDITGGTFEEVLTAVADGRPVWVITNATYDELPPSAFEKWNTPQGEISITMEEHSVVVSGFDEEFVYFHDSITKTAYMKAPRAEFEAAWIQMGQQAITTLPDGE